MPQKNAIAPCKLQVLANYFSLTKGPNYSGMAVHYDVHIVPKQDGDKPRGMCVELYCAQSQLLQDRPNRFN